VRRVLLTGARGFIGRHAVEPLLARGHEVHAVTSRPPPQTARRGLHWHRTDLLERGAGRALIIDVKPSDLLHFAWFAEPGAFWTSPENERWVDATMDLLEAFADAGGRRTVIAGSCAEYDWSAESPFSEIATPLRPATLYGRSKHELRIRAEDLAATRGLSLAWGRIFFVFGPDEHPDRLVASVIRALLQQKRAETTAGEQVRDFIYAPELARAFVALLDSNVNGAVNVATGEAVSVRSLAEMIADQVGHPELLVSGALPSRAGEPPALVADTGQLRKEVGWTPALGLAEALVRTVKWWREEA